jgi:hypothetical protein
MQKPQIYIYNIKDLKELQKMMNILNIRWLASVFEGVGRSRKFK